MTGQPIPVIIDCDTGVDDALALLFAVRHPGIDLRAITCVAGNTDVEGVVRNTLTVLEQAGAPDIPVARGAERPLIEAVRTARHVHGEDGMADLGLPAPTRAPVDVDAVTLLRREILASPRPVTLVPTAPLTNIALLLRTHPEVVRNIERIVFMGGAVATGNATPVAEFNVWHDPEAAAILLTAGVPITMYGLDVFQRVLVPAADVQRLRGSSEPALWMAGELLAHRDPDASGDPTPTGGLGDAGAVCAVVDPAGIRTELLPVEVGLAAGPGRGQTIVDRRPRHGESEIHVGVREQALVDVALDVDVERYVKLYLSTVER
ncbi:nucleoside hydrolase [Streptomyces sp. GESEQ-35]|uniref:nucleoside hydrolase n=1 Tax=Streptomyces sp. GESEQ-35 TaxID=2812657 RepID=UPI001B329E1C|nr:nucleoside hydrolase [Streptomyces sp. GESEQ-35]